jgi:hypothetical protein
MTPALAPQCTDVRRSIVADDHDLAVDQERRCLDAAGGVDDRREAIGPIVPVLSEDPQRAGSVADPPATAGTVR